MAQSTRESKPEINRENLLSTCWFNGLSIADLARKFECSRTMIYLAVEEPKRYPHFYKKICAALPLRRTGESQTH